MTLVATAGSATANSFLTVSQAIAFLVGRPGAEAFVNELQLHLQEAWLIQATGLLALKVRWLGVRANPLALVLPLVQALPLPMLDQVDAYGELLPGVIPPLVQEATALLALALAQEYTDKSPWRQGIQRLDVYQDVSVTYREGWAPVSARLRIPQEVWDLLRAYGAVPVMGRHMPVVRGQG